MKLEKLRQTVDVIEEADYLNSLETAAKALIIAYPRGAAIEVPVWHVARVERYLDTFCIPFFHKGGTICYVAKTYPLLLRFIQNGGQNQ